MAWLHNLLHSSHFTCVEPDLHAVRAVRSFPADVLRVVAGKSAAMLIALLRDVLPPPRPEVVAAPAAASPGGRGRCGVDAHPRAWSYPHHAHVPRTPPESQ